MKEIDPIALFRLSVLGPLVSRERLERGELQQIIHELSQRQYAIPNSQRSYLGEKTIEAWFYRYRHEGIVGLAPKTRFDSGQSKITPALQEAILAAKKDNPRRSIRQIRQLLESSGQAAKNSLSRSSIHRLLQGRGMSRMPGSSSMPEEKRSFVAESAGAIWYGDVMHGPRLPVNGHMRKVYLVSLLDDASRLLTHSTFCLGETALDIEGVLKQAILKRGVPHKFIVDNGSAYRSNTLQDICVRLGIHLIYCRPYSPEGKGKLERWHRTFRDQFLSELDESKIASLEDLNARLWAWTETIYHQTPHDGLGGLTPLARYQRDLAKIRTLGQRAAVLDEIFYHRIKRHVRKDGTVSYDGTRFEVAYELSGKTVKLVVDPHAGVVVGVEDDDGKSLGLATKLDAVANMNRVRRKPEMEISKKGPRTGPNLVEMAHKKYHNLKEE
jgi:putative transposase